MRKKLLLIIAAVLLIGGAVWAYGYFTQGTAVPYPGFLAELEAGKLAEVDIYKDRLTFKTTDSDTLYRTDNPDRDGFKEQLLLEETIKVTDHTKEDDSLTYYLDLVFDIFFIGLMVFGVWKLVSLYRSTFRVVHHTGIKFDRIAGMNNVKKDMMLVVNFSNHFMLL